MPNMGSLYFSAFSVNFINIEKNKLTASCITNEAFIKSTTNSSSVKNSKIIATEKQYSKNKIALFFCSYAVNMIFSCAGCIVPAFTSVTEDVSHAITRKRTGLFICVYWAPLFCILQFSQLDPLKSWEITFLLDTGTAAFFPPLAVHCEGVCQTSLSMVVYQH